MCLPSLFFFFFFNDTATTEIYTLSLHDALPISRSTSARPSTRPLASSPRSPRARAHRRRHASGRPRTRCSRSARRVRSEEHTSELQSPDHLVCRLLLEKKKTKSTNAQTAHRKPP